MYVLCITPLSCIPVFIVVRAFYVGAGCSGADTMEIVCGVCMDFYVPGFVSHWICYVLYVLGNLYTDYALNVPPAKLRL